MASTDRWPLARSARFSAKTVPPSPTSATASESTAISRASTTAPSGFGRTRGDGRPGVPRRAARSSDASPAATSSPMRVRMALRVRPVRVTSSDRDS